MVSPRQSPVLPLMVAGIPDAIVEILRCAGLPVRELTKTNQGAADTGRFLLFDSRVPSSVTRMRAARRIGMGTIDLADIDRELPGGAWDFEDNPGATSSLRNDPHAFIAQLKGRLESLGGVWLRVAEYPYPFHAALAVGLLHGPAPTPQPYSCGLPLTHFVSSRLRDEEIRGLWFGTPHELAWSVSHDDVESTARKSQTRWRTRMDRFRDAVRDVVGYRCPQQALGVPPIAEQVRLGLRFRAEAGTDPALVRCPWQLENGEQVRFRLLDLMRLIHLESGHSLATWLRLDHENRRPGKLDPDHVLNSSVITLPTAMPPVLLSRVAGSPEFEAWFRNRAEAGQAILLECPAEFADFPGLQRLAMLADGAPLLWRCTFSQFSKWLLARDQVCPIVHRTPDGYVVNIGQEHASAGYAVELWRGEHLARLPLRAASTAIPDAGLLYQMANGASPGGTAAIRPDNIRLSAGPRRTASAC